MSLSIPKIKNQFIPFEIIVLIMASFCPYVPSAIVYILIILLIVYNAFKRPYIEKRYILVMGIVFLFPIIRDLLLSINGSFSLRIIWIPVVFLGGYLIAKNINEPLFWEKFELITFVLCIFSLIGMAIMYFAPSLILSFPTYVFGKYVHRTIFICNFLYVQNDLMMRNTGIVWEPGLFQMLLNMGLLIYIKNNENPQLIKVGFYIIGIFLTKSTTGLIILIISIFALIKRDKRYLLLLVVVLVFFSNILYTEINYQLAYKYIGTESFNYRLEPTINAIKVSWSHLYGIGLVHYGESINSLQLGSFDSFTQILMLYGYPMLAYIIYILVKITRNYFYLGITLIITFLSEPIWASIFMVVIYNLNSDNIVKEINSNDLS